MFYIRMLLRGEICD